ncbi:MAG: zinc dependent phospholipase C family protein [Clostridia bacterium]|nr:zinc dependent phospholipase C family protein [Clostridia bacterium]
MPAVISHYLLAERVIPKITKNLPELNRSAFLLGANGPDIFFAHRIMPWQKQRSLAWISHIMHNGRPDVLLNYLTEYAQANHDTAALSYALGFVTHYAFDSAAHPYIVNYAETAAEGRSVHLPLIGRANEQIADGIKLSSVYHNKLEGCLDTIFLMKEKRIPVYRFRIETTCPNDMDCYIAAAKALRSYITDHHICTDVPTEEIVRAQTDWRRCLKVINDSFSVKKKLITGGERLLHIPPVVSVFLRNIDMDYSEDYVNFAHREWTSPADGTKHQDSFFDLADKAEEKSIILIEKLLGGNPLSSVDCRDSFSGKPIIQEK